MEDGSRVATRSTPVAASRISAGSQLLASAAQDAPDVEGLLASLSLEDKVGQLLLLGFDGTSAASAETQIAELRAGGIVLLANGSSADGVQALVQGLRDRARDVGVLPPLVAIDHEGGLVQRVRTGMSQLGPNRNVGSIQPLADAIAAACDRGATHGRELRAIGIDMNLAPVLDVWDNPANTVIASRAYSADPGRVAALGAAYVESLQRAGVLATAKHFPGHGSTDEDSHLALPVLHHDRARLEEVELVPFRAAVRAQVAAIMTAHVSYPLVDPVPDRPATLSPAIIGGILRVDLGYDGLVVTDDMGAMRAITGAYGPGEAAVQAIAAGADMLTIAGPTATEVEARRALLAAIGNQISEARLNQSVRRVLRAKQLAGLLPGPAAAPVAEAVCGG
jgi:beta-N-acetylhexosaminidase